MIAIRLAGLIVFGLVVTATSVDIWLALKSETAHDLVTPTHAVMLFIAIFAVTVTSNRMADRFVKFLLALRGKSGRTGEIPKLPLHKQRRKRKQP
jgi:hypothetical protein